jgi:hypothetical protein
VSGELITQCATWMQGVESEEAKRVTGIHSSFKDFCEPKTAVRKS